MGQLEVRPGLGFKFQGWRLWVWGLQIFEAPKMGLAEHDFDVLLPTSETGLGCHRKSVQLTYVSSLLRFSEAFLLGTKALQPHGKNLMRA